MKLIIVPIVAILAIVGLEIYALSQDINGAMLGWATALIAGLGGYEVKALREYIKKPK
ncbi:unnamed protein product [marine sediment metagenome]|uniref:Uncharacterized protein n=1 Tax=marine sediment metagenome TaxID=412755 RepID=X1URF0_9ZZZZ